jgi:hypothetical protein
MVLHVPLQFKRQSSATAKAWSTPNFDLAGLSTSSTRSFIEPMLKTSDSGHFAAEGSSADYGCLHDPNCSAATKHNI